MEKLHRHYIYNEVCAAISKIVSVSGHIGIRQMSKVVLVFRLSHACGKFKSSKICQNLKTKQKTGWPVPANIQMY